MFNKYDKYKVVSNNKIFEGQIDCLELVPEGPLSVFEKVRDYIHQGWVLLNHPLYGNFTPTQQPFRTILLGFKSSSGNNFREVDLQSLELIEKSILKFRGGLPNGISRVPLHYSLERDYSEMDLYLISVNLERYGIKHNLL